MTTHNLATNEGSPIARPLQVLMPLIEDDLAQGRAAAERSVLPYYRAAGEKLLEAKGQLQHGEFTGWVKRHFAVSIQMARRYMALAEQTAGQNESAVSFSSLSDFIRKTSPGHNRSPSCGPVKQIVDRVDTETLNRARDGLKRIEEREAQRKLGLQLIDIGYKVLARTFHPDKGGSRDAMTRLNAVRDRLKQGV
jgi:Protein of unknown function (DUF3102)